MKATDLTRGDWIKRDGQEFQVFKVEDNKVFIGQNGQSYTLQRVNQLLELDSVETERSDNLEYRPGSGWA
jgi:hypothetical protein